MISDVYAAIVARFDAADALAALAASGGLHADEKPAGTPYPYCVLQQRPGAALLKSFDRRAMERPTFRLRLWGTDPDELLAMAEAICATFDDVRLPLDRGGSAEFYRRREPQRHKEPGTSAEATPIHTVWVDYELFVQP